ncbi:MAG: hypothetical protein J3K34DRAFT_410592 [Monoraphidium minutum]|nr:MAG: hypothetical protein J3K34DRAFT_410592 [Monoraphidium minutum]
MQLLGLQREEARSCLALLGSPPGGVFLDVKSAYSKPRDLEQFSAVLAGVGISVRAVCSFSPRQLAFPSTPGAPAPPFDTLRFFHGINGLEAASMRGTVPRGCRLLVNGASLLLEEGETNDDQLLWGSPDAPGPPPGKGGASRQQRPPSWAGAGGAWGLAGGSLVCELSWMRFRALVDSLDLVCGIYVQERDASTAAVQALVQLVNDNPAYLPLGFAYGHLRDRVLPYISVGGRGYAGQEVLEEFQAKQDLAREAKAVIDEGRHVNASRHFVVACGRRLIGAGRWLLSRSNQRFFLHLLAEYGAPGGPPDLLRVVDECGGVRHVIYRFFRHYDGYSSLTLVEQGFNFDHTKALLRLLRNRGVLAALPAAEKEQLAAWLAGRQMYGSSTYFVQAAGLRRGLHKLAKEGLVCLMESCTSEERRAVELAATSGRPERLRLLLRGWTWVSWHFDARARAVAELHGAAPHALAYLQPGAYGFREYSGGAAPGGSGGGRGLPPTHTRDKGWAEQGWRLVRKSCCCLTAAGYNCALCWSTCGLWATCALPRLMRPWCGLAAPLVLGFAVSVVTMTLMGLFAWGVWFAVQQEEASRALHRG